MIDPKRIDSNKLNQNEDEIDLNEILNILLLGKKIVLFSLFSLATFSVIYSLSLTNLYKSETIQSFNEESENSSIPSHLEGFASLAGINMPSQGENKTALVVETIKSREFLRHLISFEKILPSIMAPKEFNFETGTMIFDESSYDPDTDSWLQKSPLENKKPSYLEAHKAYLDILSLDVDDKTGFIKISIEHLSPIFAKEFLDLIVGEVNSLVRKRDLEESSKALLYLESETAKTKLKDLKNSINKLAQAQLETQMLARIKQEYILRSIEPPFIPELKSSPQRALICITGAILGGLIGIFLVLFRHYFMNTSKKDST